LACKGCCLLSLATCSLLTGLPHGHGVLFTNEEVCLNLILPLNSWRIRTISFSLVLCAGDLLTITGSAPCRIFIGAQTTLCVWVSCRSFSTTGDIVVLYEGGVHSMACQGFLGRMLYCPGLFLTSQNFRIWRRFP